MKKRTAFTLIELLVVLVIIIALLALVVRFWPNKEARHVKDAASSVETYLAGAKTRALREGHPVTVRLLSEDGGLTYTSLQTLDAGSVWAPFDRNKYDNPLAPLTIYLDLPSGNTIQAANQNNGPVVGNVARQVGVPLQGNVEVGDLLEIVEVSISVHRIEAIDYNTNTMTLSAKKTFDPATGTWFVEGVPNVSCTTSAQLGWNYRYIRQPRPLLGEQPYKLPKDVIIVRPSGVMPTSVNVPTNAAGQLEITFAPDGRPINATGRVVLWIQDTIGLAAPRLVAVYPTGAIASHEKGPTGNEFAFTQDGR